MVGKTKNFNYICKNVSNPVGMFTLKWSALKEIAQWVKCLLHKCDDLSLDPQHPRKLDTVVLICVDHRTWLYSVPTDSLSNHAEEGVLQSWYLQHIQLTTVTFSLRIFTQGLHRASLQASHWLVSEVLWNQSVFYAYKPVPC